MSSKFKTKVLPYPFYLNKRDDVIRIHITKTAGTSLTHSMGFNKSNKSIETKKHYFAKEVIDIVGQEHWDNAFKFTFVRNPWDRLFSLYRFRIKKNKILNEEQEQRLSFAEWLKKITSNPNRKLFFKSKSQVNWLNGFDDKISLDFIGRFENYEHDVQKVAQLLNMKIDLPHINQSLPIIHYSKAYDDELEEIVRVHYKDDIDTFNYSFERK